MEEPRETIPFQNLSKLAKRMDWAVVKMTNVLANVVRLSDGIRSLGIRLPMLSLNSSAKMPKSCPTKSMLNPFI